MQKLARAWPALALALLFTPVHAEKSDSLQAMTIDADQVTVDEPSRTSVFSGRVVISQGSLLVKADKVVYRQDANSDEHLITAHGSPIHFRQKQDAGDVVEAWAEQLEYDSRAQTVRLLRRALLRRGQDEVRGDSLLYNMNTQRYEVRGGERNNPGSGRIKVTILPRRAAAATPGAAAPAAPAASAPSGARP